MVTPNIMTNIFASTSSICMAITNEILIKKLAKIAFINILTKPVDNVLCSITADNYINVSGVITFEKHITK